MAASSGQDFLLLGVADRRRLEAVYTLLLHTSAAAVLPAYRVAHLAEEEARRVSAKLFSRGFVQAHSLQLQVVH